MKSIKLVLFLYIAIVVSMFVYSDNLLTNPGFETGTTSGWATGKYPDQSGTIVINPAARTGSYGVWAYAGQSTTKGLAEVYQTVPANEGDVFRAGAFIRAASESFQWTDDSFAFVQVEFLSATASIVAKNSMKMTFKNMNWGNFSVITDPAPIGTKNVRIRLYVEKPATINTTQTVVNFDDAYLEKLEFPNLKLTQYAVGISKKQSNSNFTIKNTGMANLTYSLSENSSWLSLATLSGNLLPNETLQINLSINRANCNESDSDDTCSTEIKIISNDKNETIKVYLETNKTSVPKLPSFVKVTDSRLLVQKRLLNGSLGEPEYYNIKGTAWTPSSIGTFRDYYSRRLEFYKWYVSDINQLKEAGVNTVYLFLDFFAEPRAYDILDYLYKNDIMVIMTADEDGSGSTSNIDSIVPYYKNHPAILMWAIGNEWNINYYHGNCPSNIDTCAVLTETLAKRIKNIDSKHPVASIYGEIEILPSQPLSKTAQIVNNVTPSVDIWGANIYRGDTFGTVFNQWKSITKKPLFFSEYGTDSYYSTSYSPVTGYENETAQMRFTKKLWGQIKDNLSSINPSNICIGGTVFSSSDEWWKAKDIDGGNESVHDNLGFQSTWNPYAHPDGFANEEYFGMMHIERSPKEAYTQFSLDFNALPKTEVSDSEYYSLMMDDWFKTHINFFLSNITITKYGLPLGAYKVGNRARYGYSNPTEWGYVLQAYIAAYERGIISGDDAYKRINTSLNTMISLQNTPSQNYNKLFYPYYKVTDVSGNDVFPYHDTNVEIPSIDNGLLYMSLLITEGWAKEKGFFEIENKSKTIKDSMNFRGFLFEQNSKKYIAHLINANTGQRSLSKWDVYSDEGGLMSLIAYFSGSVSFPEFQNLTNSQLREQRTWNNHTVKEASWFNSMFAWGVRSIAGYKVSGTKFSTESFVPAAISHLDYGNYINVDYPGFSDAMTQTGGVGRHTPPNMANETPNYPPTMITPHAFFIPLNVFGDLNNNTKSRLFEKIILLQNDPVNYYFNYGNYSFGFTVIASPYANNTGFTGAGEGKDIFETLSHSYITLSLFNAMQKLNSSKDFFDIAKNVNGYERKVNITQNFLYPPNYCVDSDNDGYNMSGVSCGILDCNDDNSSIYFGAVEVCDNNIDDDCDGARDALDSDCVDRCVVPYDGMNINKSVVFCYSSTSVQNINIARDNIVVDCNNSYFIGSFSGILFNVNHRTNITLKNCNVRRYQYGFSVNDTKESSFLNINCQLENNYCMEIDNSNNNAVVNSKMENSWDSGLHIFNSRNILIKDSFFNGNQYKNGIYMLISHNNTLINNTFSGNGVVGTWFHKGGIALLDSVNNTITKNIITSNYYGIYYSSLSESYIYENSIFNNSAYNFYNYVSRNVSLEKNHWGTTNCTVINQKIRDKKDDSYYGTVDFMPFYDSLNGNLIYCNNYSLTLKQGWNLVSIPIEPDNKSISRLMSNCSFNKIWGYNKNKTWSSTDTGLSEMNSYYGYYIDRQGLNSSCVINVEGELLAQTRIDLTSGWNLVGYPSFFTRTISSVINSSSYSRIWIYDSQSGWSSTDTGLVNFSPGKGYWVNAANTGSYIITN